MDYGGVLKWGFIMENHIKVDDLGVPLFLGTSIYTSPIDAVAFGLLVSSFLGGPVAFNFSVVFCGW